jgi:hypothetical protein
VNGIAHVLHACKTGHEYMARSGRRRRPARGLKPGDQSNPKTGSNTGSNTGLTEGRFRLIVDD